MEFEHVEGFYFLPIVARSFCMKSDKRLAWCGFYPIRLRNSEVARSRLQLAPVARCQKEKTQFEKLIAPTPLSQLHDGILINETPPV